MLSPSTHVHVRLFFYQNTPTYYERLTQNMLDSSWKMTAEERGQQSAFYTLWALLCWRLHLSSISSGSKLLSARAWHRLDFLAWKETSFFTLTQWGKLTLYSNPVSQKLKALDFTARCHSHLRHTAVQTFCLWHASNQKKASLNGENQKSLFQTTDRLRDCTKTHYKKLSFELWLMQRNSGRVQE